MKKMTGKLLWIGAAVVAVAGIVAIIILRSFS
jgi:hypothetical protein